MGDHLCKMSGAKVFRHLVRMLDLLFDLSLAGVLVRVDALSAVEHFSAAASQDSASSDATGVDRVRAALGCVLLLGGCWLASRARSKVSWRLVAWGLGLQIIFALLVLRTPVGIAFFEWANGMVTTILDYALSGAAYLFGNLTDDYVPVSAPGEGDPGAGGLVAHTGSFFAFTIFPNIVFVSALMALLYHLGVMQVVVGAVAKVMQRTMRTSGAETVCAASNVFVGLMEAPLTVKPFLSRMTESELLSVMTVGMATISGGTLVSYAVMLQPYSPEIAGHVIAATIMSAPAALVVSTLLAPETGNQVTAGKSGVGILDRRSGDVNVIEATARGASEGIGLALVVGAMLVAFVALIALLNGMLGWSGGVIGVEGLTIQGLLGAGFAPVAWIIGIPWEDAMLSGQMIGIDFVVNEFVAFIELEDTLSADARVLAPRSLVVLTYALTTYANFGSVAMTVAGIGAVAPSRRSDLARLGFKAVVGGLVASLVTAALAGALV